MIIQMFVFINRYNGVFDKHLWAKTLFIPEFGCQVV